MNQCNLTRGASLLLLALLPVGCCSMLPRARSESSPFANFYEARQAIEALVPMHSDVAAMTRLGVSSVLQPNTRILTHADVVRRFVPSSLLKREYLDPGVLACLEARDACRGWEITAARIKKERTGNFWADFSNFSRLSETTGWRFNALILLIDDVAVYRAWGGQPPVNEVDVQTKPLGPLQDIGAALVIDR